MNDESLITRIDDKTIRVRLCKEFYEREAVFSAAYKISDNYDVNIQPLDEWNISLDIVAKDSKEPLDQTERIAREVINETIDQQIRRDLAKECGDTQRLIVEMAFGWANKQKQL